MKIKTQALDFELSALVIAAAFAQRGLAEIEMLARAENPGKFPPDMSSDTFCDLIEEHMGDRAAKSIKNLIRINKRLAYLLVKEITDEELRTLYCYIVGLPNDTPEEEMIDHIINIAFGGYPKREQDGNT